MPLLPSFSVRPRSIALLAAAASAPVFAACKKSSTTTTEVTAVELTVAKVASADSQTAVVGTALANPIAVKVVDQNKAPSSSATVTWKVVTGNGTVGATSTTTDASGVATTTWILGTAAGIQRVTATLVNGKVDTLVARATAAAVTSLATASDPFVQVAVGSTTPALQVRAFDQYGNGVPNAVVRWTTTAGTLSASTSTTAANGVAEVRLQTTAAPQDYVVRATVAGFTTAITVRAQ